MPNRNRAWADTIVEEVLVATGGTFQLDLLADAPVSDTLTAVRIVLDIEAGTSITGGGDFTNLVSLGIGVSSVEALSAGGASLPAPNVTDEYPPRGWLYIASKLAWTTSAQTARRNAIFQADLRSMRKVDKGRLFMRIVNLNMTGMESINVYGRVRVLCLT